MGKRLGVVDDGRAAADPTVCRIGRLAAREWEAALDGCDDRGLLAADVKARRETDRERYRPTDDRGHVGEQLVGLPLPDGRLHCRDAAWFMGVDVDHNMVGARGDRGDQGAFDDLMGGMLEEKAIFFPELTRSGFKLRLGRPGESGRDAYLLSKLKPQRIKGRLASPAFSPLRLD